MPRSLDRSIEFYPTLHNKKTTDGSDRSRGTVLRRRREALDARLDNVVLLAEQQGIKKGDVLVELASGQKFEVIGFGFLFGDTEPSIKMKGVSVETNGREQKLRTLWKKFIKE